MFPRQICCLLGNKSQVWEKEQWSARCGSASFDCQLSHVVPAQEWWTHVTSRREGSPKGGDGTGKTAWVEKPVRKRSFDTCRVVFPGTHHMRDRRITDMSVIVLGKRKIKTILCKRPSPAEREFRMVGLCTFLFDVICNTK